MLASKTGGSPIVLLQADGKRVCDAAAQLVASDRKRRVPQAA
jgi:hypothetical protein